MRKICCFCWLVLLFCIVISCDGKRPDNGVLEFNLGVKAVQKNASVEVSSGNSVVATGKTDDFGEVVFSSLQSIGEFSVKVCGGTVGLVSSQEPVAWNGCSERKVKVGETAEIVVIIDFLSSFVEKYGSETSQKEWFDYLDISGDAKPELQNTLTDSTKRWLWMQSLAKIAEGVSAANNTVAETQFSTEILLNLLFDDLTDDNVINGSTYAKFGSMPVNAEVLKRVLADSAGEVSEKFSESELKEWADKIRNSSAAFFGGESEGESGMEIVITAYPEGMKGAEVEYFSGVVVVEAAAEPERGIVSLDCSADGEKIVDTDEKAAFFKGTILTNENEGEYETVIRCGASDGKTMKSEEKTILINNDAPTVTVNFYEHGTLNETATEENPAKNTIDFKVEASHKRYAVEYLSCSMENFQLANMSDAGYLYKALIDTVNLPDGKNNIECSVTVNRRKYDFSFPFYVKNTVLVRVRPFVTNPLRDFDSVTVSCGENFNDKINDSALTDEKNIKVKIGEICRVSVSGGRYKPVISESEDEARLFNGTLTAVFKPVSDDDIVVTPLTTVEESIFSTRKKSENISADELYLQSKEHLSQHLSHAFEWNEEPLNTKSSDSTTKYYVLLSGLEYLAYFWGTKTGVEHEKYSIINVLQLLKEDYEDSVFDGKSCEKQLFFGDDGENAELDSNFFRYYYALSIKRFLKSGFNDTGFSQLGNIVNKISSNTDQFLFPAESPVIPVDSAGLKIESFVFTNLVEVENPDFAEVAGYLGNYRKGDAVDAVYDLQNGVIPYFARAFLLKFKVIPQNGNFVDLASVGLKSRDPNMVFSIKRMEPTGLDENSFADSETEFMFLAEYSDEDMPAMEKQTAFSVFARDIAFNSFETEISAFLDDKKPALSLNYPLEKVKIEGVNVSWSVADSGIKKISFVLSKEDSENEERVVFADSLENCGGENCTFTADEFESVVTDSIADGIIEEIDGVYKFAVSAFDYSENYSTIYGEFTVDTTPPEMPPLKVESNGRVLVHNSITKHNYFTVSLIEPDKDVERWALKLECADRQQNQHSVYVKPYTNALESFFFENLPKPEGDFNLVECKGFVAVCDETGNCANEDFSESAGSVFIDTLGPFYAGYDVENAVLQECVVQNGTFYLPRQCCAAAKCSTGSSNQTIVSSYQPHILLDFEDNFSSKNNIMVFIQSQELGWFKNCPYIANATNAGTCNKFYCNLEGSRNGLNNFIIRAYDEVGNYTERTLSQNMDFAVAEPVNLDVKKFVTDKGELDIVWEEKDGVEYECSITKKGDTAFSAVCGNYTIINPSDLPGTGYYTVSVKSRSASTSRTDVAEFKYFNTADLVLSVTPEKGQFVHSNDAFKINVSAESGGMAEFSKIELFLSERYLNGVRQDETEHSVISRNFDNLLGYTVSSINNKYSVSLSGLSLQKGQYRKVRAVVTFADNSKISKTFRTSSPDAFLYCLLESGEKPDSAEISFGGGVLSVNYSRPACLSAGDYSLKLITQFPILCDGRNIMGDSFSVAENYEDKFTVKGDFVFYKNEHHFHDECVNGYCDEIAHSCAVLIHDFSSETKLDVFYNSGKTFSVDSDSSVGFESAEPEIVFSSPEGEYYDGESCKKCNKKIAQPSECSGGERKTIILK
ncbi:hypothetical protein J5690_02810 [bacterium]|nr:hypothetical protein [bacterium]